MSLPNNPAVTSRLRKTQQKINPQGYHARACVLGYSSLGTRNQIYTLRSDADLAQFGNGEGVEAVAEIGAQAGWPQYLVPVAGSGQAIGSITKTPASAGVPKLLYGSALAPGSTPPAGGVLYTAKAVGVSVVQVSGGANGVAVTGSPGAQVVTVTYAAGATNTTIAGVVNGDATAFALLSAAAVGGSGTVAAFASTLLDNGALTATPLTDGVTIAIVFSGTGTALGIPAITGKAVIINGATDSNGLPNSTPNAIVTFLNTDAGAGAVAARALLGLTAGGTGAGLAAAKTTTALQYGSTAALSASGTSHDDHDIIITVTRGGTIGSTGLAFKWSADNGLTESGDVAIPTSGVKALADAVLNTGLTLTFTGVLEVGDKWSFNAPRPVVAYSDILAAVDVICAATSMKLGFILPMAATSKTQAQSIDAKLQAAYDLMKLRCMANVRDFNNAETRTAFEGAISNDFLGFLSAGGLVRMCAGHYSALSTYTGRRYRRPAVMQVAARRCALDVQQDPMQVDVGTLPNISYVVAATGAITDPGIFYDAFPNGALPSQRFICLRTWPGKPGEFYVNTSPTMADPSDVGYSLVPYSDLVIEANRIAADGLQQTVGKSYRVIPVAENELIPAGAIDVRDANKIDADINTPLLKYLYGPSNNGETRASDMPPGEKPYRTRRDYSYASENPALVKGRLRIYLRVINQYVDLDVQPVLPG